MKRDYYSDSIESFLKSSSEDILGKLAMSNEFSLEIDQRMAWLEEISILKNALVHYKGRIYFEYSIPRMGQRIDVVLLIRHMVFVLEFKIGEHEFLSHAIDQVHDYGLDLKNFHESSHDEYIAPILIASEAKDTTPSILVASQKDKLFLPIKTNASLLGVSIENVLRFVQGADIDYLEWEGGRYCPTPTIIEAAKALYKGHSVGEISRSDASAINLSQTSEVISDIIKLSKNKSQKSICFVTGVPGAGKTLVGLNIANTHMDKSSDLYSVFLSGNGPLVNILREALARDEVRRVKEGGGKLKKGDAMSKVKALIQNVHNFRDECLKDPNKAPIEHVALFDEAQRAWNVEQTSNFMRRKKNIPGFNKSEPEFLISCLDRHADWAVIVCLVGGGQEINTGEAGIGEWIDSMNRSFKDWHVYISPKINDSEYDAGKIRGKLENHKNVEYKEALHLSVSMRSFRAENVSALVKNMIDLDTKNARNIFNEVKGKYPIVITRDLSTAKRWLKNCARGTERYGIVASSQAERLKPYAIDVKSRMDPIHWFLDGKEDVRSSYYLEDISTEFDVQGLELDWVCIAWDADFRYTSKGWEHWSFCGDGWNHIRKEERKTYQKNAYRVLLTRARQGMVIVVPNGDIDDPTRNQSYFDATFNFLKDIGFEEISTVNNTGPRPVEASATKHGGQAVSF